MIRAYQNREGRFVLAADNQGIPNDAVWIDMISPTREEEVAVEVLLGMNVPTIEEMNEIEVSSRLYAEDGAHVLGANMLSRTDDDRVKMTPISFILTESRLVTLRYEEPRAIDAFIARCERSGSHSPDLILLGLIESIIERIGELLERAGHDLDDLSMSVFFTQAPAREQAAAKGSKAAIRPNARQCDFQAVLVQVGHKGDLLSKIRESLVTLQRLLAFAPTVSAARSAGKEIDKRIKSLVQDVHALSDHSSFLTQKVTFLLDATLGMISIQQTSIIKIFSVAAVVFLPPTLIASIYGMNFTHLPELSWPYGYPMALGLMVASAVVPYLFFKWRGWL